MRKKNARKNSVVLKTVVVALLSCIAAASALGFMFYNADQENKRQEQQRKEEQETAEIKSEVSREVIYDNIFINEINVGGLTKDEAMEKLSSAIEQPVGEKKITLIKGSESYPFTFQELGFRYALKEAVETAWAYARNGSDKERHAEILKLDGQPLKITAEYSVEESAVKEKISELGTKFYIEPVNATMIKQDGVFRITKEMVGEKLDEEATTAEVLQKLKDNVEGSVNVVMEEAVPAYTASAFENAQSLLGTYMTAFSAGENGRNTNLRTASEKINGSVLYPGDIFSTNAAFGAMTYDNGYRPAPVIINGKLEDDFGGGVCQVSSTLYMALLHAELEITERRNHSLKVGYLPFAYDATLAGDYIDLKFRNNLNSPVYIEARIQDGSKVVVNVYGEETRSSNRKLVFQNALIDTITPQDEEIIQDASLPQGQRLVSTAAKTGYKYNLYKIVYEADKEVERVLVNVSTYRAVRGQVRVGTGPANLAADTNITPEVQQNTAAEATPDPVEEVSELPAITEPAPEPVEVYVQGSVSEPSEEADGPLMPE